MMILLSPLPVSAQTVGAGFVLDAAGSVTVTASEVISQTGSIKGSYFGTGVYTPYLHTDSRIFQFSPAETYRITFRYRILTAPSAGFEVLFYSPTGGISGNFLPSATVTGSAGDSGTGTLTSRLQSFSDYQAVWNVVGTGAIAIDDIQIVNVGTGQVVASENAEGPSIDPGILNLRVTDTKTFTLGPSGQEYLIRSGTVRDLAGDGYPEIILTVTTYPDQRPQPPLLIDASAGISLATNVLFPAGAPTVRHSPVTLFADINGDGLQDILFADAGLDHAPWTGSGIGVGLNIGGGRYKDVSWLVPSDLQTTRSYSLAAGDIDGNGRTEIILPDQDNGVTNGRNTALLRWNGNSFDAQTNWIDRSLWGHPTNLSGQSWLGIHDLDEDGKQDLLVTGDSWNPNVRVLFGSSAGFSSANLVQLPEGLFGHTPFATAMDPSVRMSEGAHVGPAVVADFNNDGLLDVFSIQEQVVHYKPGVITDTNAVNYDDLFKNGGDFNGDIAFQVLMNKGMRHFVDYSQASSIQNLGKRLYQGLMPVDLNNDGFVDVVGIYATKPYGGVPGFVWGTTLFLNDGTGAFQVVDGTALLSTFTTIPSHGDRYSMGAFLPTVVKRDRTEGIFVAVVNGTSGALNAYKVVSNSSIGTGPGFVDSASLGVPGFNEFYYLRHYPAAAASVRSGQYTSGLAHYLAVGKRAGYNISAPNAKSGGFPFSLVDRGSISRTGTETSSLITTGYARVQADQGSTTPAGVAIYGYRPGNYLVSETAVPATLPARSGRIYAEVSTSVTTGLAIANPNDQPATIDFYYTDAAGADTGAGRITLGPKSQFANFIDQAPLKRFSASTFEGTFSYASNVPVSAMAIRGVFNERGDFLMSTLPVIDLSSPPQTGVVVVPHFADGGGWTTQILLVNPGNAAANGKVEFRDPNGALTSVPLANQATGDYLIPPRSSRKLATTGAGATTTGSVRIIPTGGIAAPIALIVFSYKPAGVVLSQAGVTSVRGTALRMYAASAAIPFQLQTGLALANIGSAEITVTFELFNHDGSTTGLPLPSLRTLAAFGQTAMFLSDIFSGTLPDPFSGVLRISTSSSDGISAVGLRSLYNEQGDFLITTTPPTDEAPPTDASERIFPHLAFGGGYSTEFVLFSGKYGQSSTGTVWLLSNSGVPLYVPLR